MGWLADRKQRKQAEQGRRPEPSGSAAGGLHGKSGSRVHSGRETVRLGSDNDPNVYAFVGYGLMLRFTGVDQIRETLPSIIARASGVPASRVVVVETSEYIPDDKQGIDSMDGEGQAVFPDEHCDCIHDWLDKKALFGHQLGGQELLGIMGDEGSGIVLLTNMELKESGRQINAAQVLFTAWICFPNDLVGIG